MYQKFVERWLEITELPPQTLGPFTPLYKMLTKRLKIMPWPAFFLISTLVVVGLYILLGTTVTFLVSILQKGF